MIATETHIVKEIQSGNERVFEALFRSHYESLHIFAKSFIADPDQAEEIVQDVFFKIWEKRHQLDITTSIKAYLYSSVRNTCLNYIKHLKVRAGYADFAMNNNSETFSDVDEQVEYSELEEKIRALMESLPEQCQRIFRMSRFDGKKQREIAEELGISIKTVENQMGRALKVMREGLKGYGPYTILIILHVLNNFIE